MSPPGRGARGDQAASAPTPSTSVGRTKASIDGPLRRHDARQAAERRIASWRLDELLYGEALPADPIDWHEIQMDLGVPEREYLGRELAALRG